MGTNGVFMAEPVSNVIGGSMCFITMLATVLPELNRMKDTPLFPSQDTLHMQFPSTPSTTVSKKEKESSFFNYNQETK